MDLEAFISESLTAIARGVNRANTELQPDESKDLKPFILLRDPGTAEARIDFDVAVTSAKAGGGKAGIQVAGLGVGVGGWGRAAEERVSRIRFRVAINKHLV